MQRVSFMVSMDLPVEMDPEQFTDALQKDMNASYEEFYDTNVVIDGVYVQD